MTTTSGNGDGQATITYQAGNDPVQTVVGDAGLYVDSQKYVTISASWSDSAGNQLSLFIGFQSSGTGIYDSASPLAWPGIQAWVSFLTEPKGCGWSNQNVYNSAQPGVVVNLIATPTANSYTLVHASVGMRQLPWAHTDSQPDQLGLNLSMSVFVWAPPVIS